MSPEQYTQVYLRHDFTLTGILDMISFVFHFFVIPLSELHLHVRVNVHVGSSTTDT